MQTTYFRRGFGLKQTIQPIIAANYHSSLVDRIREDGYTATFGDLTFRLAKEFGFCYGVDRAVDYAYETAHKFPDRRIFLVGEIIHNPHVNNRLQELGIRFLHPTPEGEFDFGEVTPDDVVILPAFGATLAHFKELSDLGCILVDTTCGSVLNVWKRVDSYARDGFTALIHGKYFHEESRATASQVHKHEGGKYVVVRDMDEARLIMDFIERNERALAADELRAHFAEKASAGFDPETDLVRIGVANQTTMLATESLAIAAEVGKSMAIRYGEENLDQHFRSFDTICSATQERQDAVLELMQTPPDIMIVIGGYNSSNTNHLAHLCRSYTTTYHISDSTRIDAQTGTISHKPVLDPEAPESAERDWLPSGPLTIGITAGASTPNNKIGEAIEFIVATRGGRIP
jgi:4-hydroxy-3-methylbut-2-enyl diphosphate reductase